MHARTRDKILFPWTIVFFYPPVSYFVQIISELSTLKQVLYCQLFCKTGWLRVLPKLLWDRSKYHCRERVKKAKATTSYYQGKFFGDKKIQSANKSKLQRSELRRSRRTDVNRSGILQRWLELRWFRKFGNSFSQIIFKARSPKSRGAAAT